MINVPLNISDPEITSFDLLIAFFNCPVDSSNVHILRNNMTALCHIAYVYHCQKTNLLKHLFFNPSL